MRDLFSDTGIAAWLRHLRESTAFREAAASWIGTALIVRGASTEEDVATWLSVDRGAVDIRPATSDDRASAEFVLAADQETWQKLAAGSLSPISAAMTGKLKLLRGDLLRLAAHGKAISALLGAEGS